MDELINDVEGFKSFLAEQAKNRWSESQSPYFISFIAKDLSERGVDYRRFTAPLKLREWLLREDIPGIKVVAHNDIKAKVALVPREVSFSFGSDGVSQAERKNALPISRSDYTALIRFVNVLRDLPKDELRDFNVPATVLVALVSIK